MPGFAAMLPVLVQRSIQRIAVEAPTLSSLAASRALSPSWTIATKRSLRSFEYPRAIEFPSESFWRERRTRGQPSAIYAFDACPTAAHVTARLVSCPLQLLRCLQISAVQGTCRWRDVLGAFFAGGGTDGKPTV